MNYALRRIGFACMTVFAAITINFVLFHAAPGDPVTRLARVPGMTAEGQEALRDQFGLNHSLWTQYVTYLKETFQGNFGVSFQNRQPVVDNVKEAYLNTIPMVAAGTIFAIVFGTLFGTLAAWKRNRAIDHASVTVGLTFYSMPTQWLGLMLIALFGSYLPVAGMSDPFLIDPSVLTKVEDYLRHMILPAATLGLVLFGQYTLLVRSALAGALSEDYVLTARAKGLKDSTIVRRHALRNALLPISTLIALSLGYIVAGSILVETVFSWPGIGDAIYGAVIARDYPTLQACLMVVTVSVIIANLIADLLYVKLDPRVSTS